MWIVWTDLELLLKNVKPPVSRFKNDGNSNKAKIQFVQIKIKFDFINSD